MAGRARTYNCFPTAGLDGDTTGDLNPRTIARLAGFSPALASRILPQLVQLGHRRTPRGTS